MVTMPTQVAELLDRALVAELTVVDGTGRPVTYPLIPLWDGERVYMTSSTLFSRKLEHIDGNAQVSVSITDPVSVDGRTDRARSRATPGSSPRIRTVDGSGCSRSGQPRSRRSSRSSRRASRCRCSSSAPSSRSRPRRVLYWSRRGCRDRPGVTTMIEEAA